MKNTGPFIAMALLCACGESREEKQKECDAIAEEIRAAARARSIPVQGACHNPAAPEFAGACAKLRKCNEELDEL